jgi:hypothetical protein
VIKLFITSEIIEFQDIKDVNKAFKMLEEELICKEQ